MKKIGILLCFSAAFAISFAVFAHFRTPDYSGIVLTVASTTDISTGSLQEGAAAFCEKYGCEVRFTDDFSACDLIYSSGEDFSACLPITKYVNKRNKLYTRSIIENSCTQNGEIYGITNVLLGNLNYCTYYPDQFGENALPYDYYKNGAWSWDGFIEMTDAIGANIAVDWLSSYINMRYTLSLDKNGETVFDYGTHEQIEWLNFVRTLIYDKGIVDNSEGAFEIGFLPASVLENTASGTNARYIPLPSKTGKITDMFVDEYHFCVPKTAQNPKLSVKLADAMIASCTQTRMNLYHSCMTAEDFKLFKKQLNKIYTYPAHTDYVPAQSMVEDFVHGKTVTEHIFNTISGAEHIK